MNHSQKFTLIGLAIFCTSISLVYATNTSISDVTTTLNNLVVVGTCTGCGASETTFTSWPTLFKDNTVSDGGNVPMQAIVDDNGNSIFTTGGATPNAFFIRANGTNSNYIVSGLGFPDSTQLVSQSISGKYQIIYDESTHKINVSSNGTALYNITLDFAAKFNAGQQPALGISPNGKYIIFVDNDFADHSKTRYQVYRGS